MRSVLLCRKAPWQRVLPRRTPGRPRRVGLSPRRTLAAVGSGRLGAPRRATRCPGPCGPADWFSTEQKRADSQSRDFPLSSSVDIWVVR